MHKIFLAASLFLIVCGSSAVFAQQTANNALLQTLLDLPAPPPKSLTGDRPAPVERAADFYDLKKPPADDAPLADLLDYWSRANDTIGSSNFYRESTVRPTETVMRRLVDAMRDELRYTPLFLNILPRTPEVIELVRQQYAASQNDEDYPDAWASSMKKWLKYNTNENADELFAKAQKVRDEKSNTANEDELFALANVDWDRAKPLLERLENDASQGMTRVSAMWAMYRHAMAVKDSGETDKYRDRLKRIVEDRSAPNYVRDKAMDALAQSDGWEGRDEWYLSLLSDETLFLLSGDNGVYTGLTTLVLRESEDKWIPIMARLVESSDVNVRNAAVRNLIQMRAGARKDALEPLLPWLTNPAWAKDAERGRISFISALKDVDLPQAVPGLIQVVLNEDDDFRVAATLALIRYKDPRAIPALRLALQKETREYLRGNIIGALIASGGFTDDELAAALENYVVEQVKNAVEREKGVTEDISIDEGNELFARRIAVSKGEDYLSPRPSVTIQVEPETVDALREAKRMGSGDENPTSIETSIGQFLSQQTDASDGLILRLLPRLKVLRNTNPRAAKELFAVMQKWNSRLIDLERIERVKTGTADDEAILLLLASRKTVRERIPGEVFAMRGDGGIALGVSAAMLEDAAEVLSAINGADTEARITALACARLLRIPLPVRTIAPYLKDKNKLVALAAERYLESEDSPEAQGILIANRPNESQIFGARDSFNPKQTSVEFNSPLSELFDSVDANDKISVFNYLDEFEKKIQKEIAENADLQGVYGFVSNDDNGHAVVRVYKDRAVFMIYENTARYRERNLTDKEFEAFRIVLGEHRIETLPPLGEFTYGSHGAGSVAGEFLAVTGKYGRRVFFDLSEVPEQMKKNVQLFDSFRESDNLKLHYFLQDKIKGLEVLLDDENLAARAVWKQGSDLRVAVEDSAKEAQINETNRKLDEAEDASEEIEENKRYEIQQARRANSAYAHFSWRKIADGKLGDLTLQPADAPFLPEAFEQPAMGDEYGEDEERRAWQSRLGNSVIRAGYYGDEAERDIDDDSKIGLWRVQRSQPSIFFKKGDFSSPLVTPDQKWIIAAKTVETRDSIVRINAATGKETPVAAIPTGENLQTITFIQPLNKVLIQRIKNEGSQPEFYLLDAATGAAIQVKGDFSVFNQQTYRPLQSSAQQPGALWAAISNPAKNETNIGLYDTKTFAFKSLLTVPQIEFDSMDFWADETEGKIYFVSDGQLLSLPLRQETAR